MKSTTLTCMTCKVKLLAYMGLTQVRKNYLAKQIPQLPTLLATASEARIEVSPEVAGEGVGTRFLHPWDVLMKYGRVANRSVGLAPLLSSFCAGVIYYLLNERITVLIFLYSL